MFGRRPQDPPGGTLIRAALAVAALAAMARASLLSMDMSENGGDLTTVLSVDGFGSRRYPVPFDPAFMEVRLLDAWVETADGTRSDLPGWAVDTLGSSSGMPLALVVAFPGRMDGGGFLRVETVDHGGLWDDGAWLGFTAPEWADSVRITMRGLGQEFAWEGDGYSLEMDGSDAVFTAAAPAGRLSVSAIPGWRALYSILSESYAAALDAERPVSVAGAALEAGAAGADITSVMARLRTIVCNSFTPESPGHPCRLFAVDPLDELMSSRSADRLELALVTAAILDEAGIRTELLFGSACAASVPVPTDWDRPVISAVLSDGRTLLIDPSAYLNSAFHIPGRESLSMLGPRGDAPLPPAAGGPEDYWREAWDISGDGSFRLELSTGGAADSLLRHRLAGLDGPSASAALALWLLSGGQVAIIDSMETTDLFDLAEGASMRVGGRLAGGIPPGEPSRLPLLPGCPCPGMLRTWKLPGRIEASCAGLRIEEDGCTVVDTAALASAPVVLTGGAR